MKKIIALMAAALFCFAAQNVQAKSPKGETVVYKVAIDCKNCVKKVQENISFEKGVTDLKVSLEDQTVTVTYNPEKTSVLKLQQAIEKLGYKVSGVQELGPKPDKEPVEKKKLSLDGEAVVK